MNQSHASQLNPTFPTFGQLLGREIGNVVIQKELGRGAMGAVFLGYQKVLERSVAVKVMLPTGTDTQLALGRFRREAQAIARLRSPYIVQVFDTGVTSDQLFYIVMEFLEGKTLTSHLEGEESFPVSLALEVAWQVAKGLDVAHQAGIVHRDIKPDNLMISNDHQVSITDFGLARGDAHSQTLEDVTVDGSILGTPAYMAPEQILSQPLDGRCDIYALGLVLFEMLVGHHPFEDKDPMTILTNQVQKPLPDPRQWLPNLSEEVCRLLQQMTAKDRENRIQNSGLLAKELEVLCRKHQSQKGPTGTLSYTSYQLGVSGASVAHSAPSSGPTLSYEQPSSSPETTPGLLSSFSRKAIQEELACYIGPIAKVVLKQEAKALGFSLKEFPINEVELLMARLQTHLPSEQQALFLQAIQERLQAAS